MQFASLPTISPGVCRKEQRNSKEKTYNPGNPKLLSLLAITTEQPPFPPTVQKLLVVTSGSPPTDCPLLIHLSVLVQISVLSFGISTLLSALRQSARRVPPEADWPQLIPVLEGKTAVAVVEVEEGVTFGIVVNRTAVEVDVGVVGLLVEPEVLNVVVRPAAPPSRPHVPTL